MLRPQTLCATTEPIILMRPRRTFLFATMAVAGLLTATAAVAEMVDLQLTVPAGNGPAVPVVVTVAGGSHEPVQLTAKAPSVLSIDLVGSSPWTISVEADGMWSLPVVLDGPPRPVRVPLYPARSLHAVVKVPDGAALPDAITLRLRRSESAEAASHFAEALLACPLDGRGQLRCSVPALAKLDLRLRAPGFASRFFWDLDLSQRAAKVEPYSLGEVRLRPGASVVGNVDVPPGIPPSEISVRLENAAGSPPPGDEEPLLAFRAYTGTVDERGFFSIEGLAPGLYRLIAEHPDLAPVELDPVKVLGGAQTEIREPLVLVRPRPLNLVVVPGFDPYQADWNVRVSRQRSSMRRVAVAEGTTTAGLFAAAGLGSGAYDVEIFDSRGARVAQQRVEDASAQDWLEIDVQLIQVEGMVALGADPLVARLRFRGPREPGPSGGAEVSFESNVEGHFEGYLPEPGIWDVEVESAVPPVRWRSGEVAVEARDGRASLELRLPDTTLRGLVTVESGEPVRGADVTATPAEGLGRAVTARSDLEGRFDFHGLPEGDYRVEAAIRRGDELLSGQSDVLTLREDLAPDPTIVVRPRRLLAGRLVDSAGEAVSRVWIEVEPRRGAVPDLLSGDRLESGLDGRFEMRLPAETTAVDLTVLAPGFALTRRTVPMGDVGDLVLSRLGGTLDIRLPGEIAWGDPMAPRPFVIDGNGSKLYLGLLLQWARLNGVATDLGAAPERVEIPLLSPGVYSLCWVTGAEAYDPSSRGSGCVGGELTAGGALPLSLPPAPESRPAVP